MHVIDYLIVAFFLIGLLVLGWWLSKRAGKSTDEFILAGRNMPWWLAGASLLATNLNASSMLQDSRKVRQDGIGGLWFTWRSMISAVIGSVFFNRLWRRAGFVTQMEFYHCRYHGRGADVARTFDSVIYGIIVAAMWASIGLVGMKKIAAVLLGLPTEFVFLNTVWNTDIVVIIMLLIITLTYSAASGVYGVVWTDMVEGAIALIATYVLMIMVLADVGGPAQLRHDLLAHTDGEMLLSLMPSVGAVFVFFIVFSVMEQGGYNPHIQRSLCLKNEREVMLTTLYSEILNRVIKAWPYYICGLAGIFLISDSYLLENFDPGIGPDGAPIADYEMVFPALVRQYLPVGLTGLMAAGFLSAFMSSFDTNIHNSTCIFTNDIYRAYVAKGKTEKHYVRASRVYMIAVTILAALIGILVNDILYLFMFAINVMQSVGMIKLIRFIWWRSNIWGELSAQVCSIIITILMLMGTMDTAAEWLVGVFDVELNNDTKWVARTALLWFSSTTVSLIVVLLTPPEPMDRLVEFYERVRPFGFWGPVRKHSRVEYGPSDSLLWLTVLSVSIITTVLALIFLFMGILLAWWAVVLWSLPFAVSGGLLYHYAIRKLYP